MKSFIKNKSALIAFVILACIRILFCFLNHDANDNHLQPVELFLIHNKYPAFSECHECFQPPLVYSFVKVVSQLTKQTGYEEFRFVFQAITTLISIAFLYFIFAFHYRLNLSDKWKLILAVFWGLNPKLITIGSQYTNDNFILLFGMIFITIVISIFKNQQIKWNLLLLGLIAVLAPISKGTGLILTALFCCILFIYLLKAKWTFLQKAMLFVGALFIVFISIAYFGNYYKRYLEAGETFAINVRAEPFPVLYGNDTFTVPRPGIKSISEAFGTFYITSLVDSPFIVNDYGDVQKLRRSFWTLLYGQYSNALFEQFPNQWKSEHPDMMHFASVNYLIQLPLFILLLFGFGSVFGQNLNFKWSIEKVYLLLTFLSFVFLIKASMTYRDFCTMKLTYIMCVLPAMIYYLYIGITAILRYKQISKFCSWLFLISIALYVINLYFAVNALILNG